MKLVKLDYFKESGKWYASGELYTDLDFWDTCDLVRNLMKQKRLPGLVEGVIFDVLMTYDELPHFFRSNRLYPPEPKPAPENITRNVGVC